MMEKLVRVFVPTLAVVMTCWIASAHGEAPDSTRDVRETGERYLAISLSGADEAHVEQVIRFLGPVGHNQASQRQAMARLVEGQVREAAAPVVEAFEPLPDEVGDGIKKFFYEGNDAAVAALEPWFELGLKHPEVLAAQPELVDLVFRAGLVLIRAHLGEERHQSATKVAHQMARAFPFVVPTTDFVPPQVVEFYLEQAEVEEELQSTLVIEATPTNVCEIVANGSRVEAGKHAIRGGQAYMLGLVCDGERAALRRLHIPVGASVTVPLVDLDRQLPPLMGTDEVAHAQWAYRLKAIAFWADVETVIAVREEDERLVVARWDGASGLRWQETSREAGHLDGALRTLLPEVTLVAASEDDDSVDWMGFGAAGVGTILAGTGGFLLWGASVEATELMCSPDAVSDVATEECNGVSTRRFQSAAEFDDARQAVWIKRGVGYSALGVGLAVAGYGAWRLVSGSTRMPEVAVSPIKNGWQARMLVRF